MTPLQRPTCSFTVVIRALEIDKAPCAHRCVSLVSNLEAYTPFRVFDNFIYGGRDLLEGNRVEIDKFAHTPSFNVHQVGPQLLYGPI